MSVDDDTGWNDVLVGGWSSRVREAVVARVDRATVGQRGLVIRTLADPDAARYAWVEQLHALVVGAIRDETGADLDALGSQAAWACYDEVWAALTARWADGGSLPAVPLGAEPAVARLLQELPTEVAEHAGAEVSDAVPDPLWLKGRLRVDVEGLWACIAHDDGRLTAEVRATIDAILERCVDR